MITLGIESSCDETAAAVLQGTHKILSSVVFSSLKEHREFGGVVPEIASRSHLENLLDVLDEAVRKAKISLKDIDCIAATKGPGLMGSLLVGLSAAKAISLSLKKPLVGVDHVIAHVYSGFLSEPSVKFPVLGLVVSGGHTLLIHMESPSRYEVLGRTLDDAAGEAFDKVAKILGLGYPGGPEIDRLSRGVNPQLVSFSRPYLSKDSLDFSFSGIKTAVLYRVDKKKLSPAVRKQTASGFQEAVCDVLVKKTIHAAQMRGLKTIIVGGGVSANSRLRHLMAGTCKKEGLKVVFPSNALCQDNAAMIASLGAALYKEGKRDGFDLAAYPKFSDGNKTRRI